MVYRDIQNGVGRPVQTVRSATASALVVAQRDQNADAKGCTVIQRNLIYFPLNNLFVVYRDIQNGVGMPVQAPDGHWHQPSS
jgi:hypothetical protein